jgi:hypothetical protein
MQGTASLEVSYVVYKYTYASAGWEVWKNGKLLRLRNVSNYNGDKYSLRGEVAGEALQVEVNGKKLETPVDAWATSYWKLPPAQQDVQQEKKAVVLLDSDQGKKMNGQLAYVGKEEVAFGERTIQGTHYKITGDVTVDIWFDASQRLVRSESLEMGQKTICELSKINVELGGQPSE